MILFSNTNWENGLSTEEIEAALDRIYAWFDRLSAEGVMTGGHPLFAPGYNLNQQSGKTVIDGPFAESKEAVAGFIVVRAASLEDAVALAREAPQLQVGMGIQVRQVAPACPTILRLHADAAAAT